MILLVLVAIVTLVILASLVYMARRISTATARTAADHYAEPLARLTDASETIDRTARALAAETHRAQREQREMEFLRKGRR